MTKLLRPLRTNMISSPQQQSSSRNGPRKLGSTKGWSKLPKKKRPPSGLSENEVQNIISVHVTKKTNPGDETESTDQESSVLESHGKRLSNDSSSENTIVISVDLLQELSVAQPNTVDLHLEGLKENFIPLKGGYSRTLASQSRPKDKPLEGRLFSQELNRQQDYGFPASKPVSEKRQNVLARSAPELQLPTAVDQEMSYRHRYFHQPSTMGSIGIEHIRTRPKSKTSLILPALQPEPCRLYTKPPLAQYTKYSEELKNWLYTSRASLKIPGDALQRHEHILTPTIHRRESNTPSNLNNKELHRKSHQKPAVEKSKDQLVPQSREPGTSITARNKTTTQKFVMTWLQSGAEHPRFSRTLWREETANLNRRQNSSRNLFPRIVRDEQKRHRNAKTAGLS